jgi:gluconate 5-dehydrogenase
MNDLFDCRGRTALVTGASRGLGQVAAIALADAGASVILNGRDASALKRSVAAIRETGGLAEAICGDLITETEQIVDRAVALNGGLDVVVHAAAARDRRPTNELSSSAFGDLLESNLTSAYGLARTAIPYLTRSDAGRLIFITSIAAQLARAGDPAYAAAKGGLSALTRSLAVEFGKAHFTVNAIAPGFFATETNATLVADPSLRSFIELRVPSQRWGKPPEIASAVLFLAARASSYVNGITVTVDGGLSSQM